ncbi:efflux RND transporter periplasmic adaptor subunit [Phosphitispora fastidiosa]|uniref:efflux RND transporter periplasmic adaptor subunit n=1 Tax=Phosphitispora fastidiosa TaxID=2837202 RepID=UPI001E58231D|nr:efflux RND transporter periplasmic adaptor subunit [Phosphitispora fastidiosa]MBU7007007.1 RND family efflux transporter MFP subunit [Phosphitispora fastidiosa]
MQKLEGTIMTKSQKKYLLVCVVLVIALGMLAGWRIKKLQDVPAAQAGSGFPVETVKVGRDVVSAGLTYVGTVEPLQEVDLSAKISARILSLAGKEGDILNAGQTVVTLDSGDLQGKINTLGKKVQAAGINRDYWEKQIELYRPLLEEGAISEHDFQKTVFSRDTAASGYEEAEAALDEARINLNYSILKTPMTGTVTKVHSFPGDMAVPGKPVITLADVSRLKISVKVVQDDVAKLKKGGTVMLSAGEEGREFPAEITEIFPSLDPNLRTGTVEISVPQEIMQEYSLKPGMSVNVFFVLGQREDVPVVPKQTVQQDNQNNYFVYVVKEGVARKQIVETGLSSDRLIEIKGGLNEGDRVVSSGLVEVYDGRPLYLKGEEG